MPVIGFVSLGKLENVKTYKLPIVFTSNGAMTCDCTPESIDKCDLILLDDDNYSAVKVDGNNASMALLVQHNANATAWQQQEKKLKEWHWSFLPIDRFSHVSGDSFWEKIRALITEQQENERNKILREIKQQYDSIYMLRTLDTWAAWSVIASLDDTNKNKSASQKRNRIVDEQMNEIIQAALAPHSGDLSASLNCADEIAINPIQWLADKAKS